MAAASASASTLVAERTRIASTSAIAASSSARSAPLQCRISKSGPSASTVAGLSSSAMSTTGLLTAMSSMQSTDGTWCTTLCRAQQYPAQPTWPRRAVRLNATGLGVDPETNPGVRVRGRVSGFPDVRRAAPAARLRLHDHSRITHQEVRRVHRRRRRHLHAPDRAASPASSGPTAPASPPPCGSWSASPPPTSGTATHLRPPVSPTCRTRAARSASCSTRRRSTPVAPAARS